MTKKGAGLVFTLVSALLAIASAAAYLYNCKTPYFSTIGVSAFVVAFIAAGAVIQLLAVIAGSKGQKTWMESD